MLRTLNWSANGILKITLGRQSTLWVFTFIVLLLGYKFSYPWIPRAVIEELSSQHRSEKSLKIGDSPETRETELDVDWTLEWRVRGHARYAAQTASERQASSQWKSARERGADEERKFSDMVLWRRRWRCDGITFNCCTGLPHLYFPSIHSYLSIHCLRKTWFNNTERTPCNKWFE